MDFEELALKAYSGEKLPAFIPQYQQLAYLSLRQLYGQYASREISKAEAMKDKSAIAYAFHEAERKSEQERRSCAYWLGVRVEMAKLNRTIEECGCPLCKRMVRILDGRESI